MSFFDRLARNVDLMPRLAQRLGIDWADRMDRSPYAAAEYRHALMRCAECPNDGACRAWVERAHQADAAPDYCRNKEMLQRLAKDTEKQG